MDESGYDGGDEDSLEENDYCYAGTKCCQVHYSWFRIRLRSK